MKGQCPNVLARYSLPCARVRTLKKGIDTAGIVRDAMLLHNREVEWER